MKNIRGISADIKQDDTFHNDQHKDLKADYIMANLPFNQKDWHESNKLTSDARWSGYDAPPTSNANYGWILNILSILSAKSNKDLKSSSRNWHTTFEIKLEEIFSIFPLISSNLFGRCLKQFFKFCRFNISNSSFIQICCV